jgi:hypothetical protein
LQSRDEDSFPTPQSVQDYEKILLLKSEGNAFLCGRYDTVAAGVVVIMKAAELLAFTAKS